MKTSHLIPLCAVLLAASVTAGNAQAPPGNWCGTTPDPGADFPSLAYNASTDAVIAGINQSRAAEGLPALVLPRNYAQLPDEQKVIVLINLERTARRLSPFNSGNPQLSGNDPVLGYAATNHSTLLQHTLALHPGFTNPNGGSVWHDNSIEGTVRQRLGALPGFEGGVSAWSEIIASGSPEGAVYGWMYQDSGSRWGHRHNILGIDACFTWCRRWIRAAHSWMERTVRLFPPPRMPLERQPRRHKRLHRRVRSQRRHQHRLQTHSDHRRHAGPDRAKAGGLPNLGVVADSRGQPRVGRRGAVVRDLRRDGLWPAERHPAGVDLPDDDLGPTDDPDRLPGWDDLPGDPGPTPVRRGGGPLSGHQGL